MACQRVKNVESKTKNMQQDFVWYFAYGSNLSLSQMFARVGEWSASRKATLKGWKLVFNVNSKKWGKGAANIIRTEDPNDVVYGATYLIRKEKLCVLSTYEGVMPKDVTVESNGKDVLAKTYVFRKDKTPSEPPKAYLQAIIEGLRQHGYDENIINKYLKQ